MNESGAIRGLTLFAAVCAGSIACSETDAEAGRLDGASVSDSAGVTLVRFEDLSALSVPEREVTLSFEVGTRAGTELYRVTAARLLDSGRLVIGNSGTSEILYLDATGELVNRAGGEGDGPGEFRAITSFPAVRGDTLTIYDVRAGRLTVLDRDGAVVETRPLEPPSRVVDLVPLAVGDSGRVLAIHGDARTFARSGVRRDTAPLMIIHPSSRIDTLGMWPAQEWSFGSTDRGSLRTVVGFGRSLEASGRNGRAVVGSTDSLILVVVDLRAEGNVVMRIEGTGPNRPVSAEEVERWRAELLAGLPDDIPARIRTALETTPNRETLPAFSGVVLDADGRVWVGEALPPGSDERSWVVFAPDGTPAFRVALPESATLLDAAGDRLVVHDRTELAEEVVRVLTLREPISTASP